MLQVEVVFNDWPASIVLPTRIHDDNRILRTEDEDFALDSDVCTRRVVED